MSAALTAQERDEWRILENIAAKRWFYEGCENRGNLMPAIRSLMSRGLLEDHATRHTWLITDAGRRALAGRDAAPKKAGVKRG